MLIAIPRETWPNEPRVAASPETVKKLIALGYSIAVESGAGAGSYFSDQAFADAGADIRTSPSTLYADAHLILKVRRPAEEEVSLMKRGAVVVAILAPFGAGDALQAYATAGLTTFSMDLMPRITRAQSMDVLSSQSNLAGYKAVIDASAEYGRALPMMMTAAGTVAPAKTFVMGAGVAGLQAIATAKRLGSVVSATDVRPAVKEQVESLGGSFIMVDSEEAKDAETSGGYAKEMSDDFKRAQAALVAEHIAKQDIVICTALIPGRPAPTLVTEEMVRAMKPGAIIVDLAVEQGGNCPLSRVGEIVDVDGVKIIGFENVPGRLAADASSLYARNLLNFLSAFTDTETGLKIDWEDEIIKGVCLTHDGAVVHESFAPTSAPAPAPAPANDAPTPGETSA